MSKPDPYGSVDAYAEAFAVVVREGVPDKHLALLEVHAAAPRQTASWRELAPQVGYPTAGTVNLQYGTFAHRIANALGIFEKPGGFWLNVLAESVEKLDADGHTRFWLRKNAREGAIKAGLIGGGKTLRVFPPGRRRVRKERPNSA
jgi:hypothetical protein